MQKGKEKCAELSENMRGKAKSFLAVVHEPALRVD